MDADRLSIIVDRALGTEIREAAARAGVNVSRWIASAAEKQLRQEALRLALDEWDAEDGPLSEQELNEARKTLGLPPFPSGQVA